MSFGLRTWDASGNPMLDTSDRIARFVGSYSFNVTTTNRTFCSVPGFALDGSWFFETTHFEFQPTFKIEPVSGGFYVTIRFGSPPATFSVNIFRW